MSERNKPSLVDASEDKLKELLRAQEKGNFGWTYDLIVGELDRRAANRQARATLTLSIVSVGIALLTLIVTAGPRP